MSKPIDELTIEDLQTHPIWEYAMDEEEGDETYVRPVDSKSVPNETNYIVYSVACDFTTATGKRFTGFLQIEDGDFHMMVPVVVGGLEDYWCMDSPPARRERAKFEAFFGAEYSRLFPMKWSLRVLLDREANLRTGVFSPDVST